MNIQIVGEGLFQFRNIGDMRQEPQFDGPSDATLGMRRVSIFVEVQGAGDYLPPYSGNLDIMTAAATRAGEGMAKSVVEERAQRASRNHETEGAS